MAASYAKAKARKTKGQFVNIPHSVLEDERFMRLSSKARALLIDMCHQIRFGKHGIKNNGDLCTAWGYMQKRGWGSAGTVHAAKNELIDSGWLIQTRQGGKRKPSLYAIAWLRINESEKYDDGIKATDRPLGNRN